MIDLHRVFRLVDNDLHFVIEGLAHILKDAEGAAKLIATAGVNRGTEIALGNLLGVENNPLQVAIGVTGKGNGKDDQDQEHRTGHTQDHEYRDIAI